MSKMSFFSKPTISCHAKINAYYNFKKLLICKSFFLPSRVICTSLKLFKILLTFSNSSFFLKCLFKQCNLVTQQIVE